MSLHLRSKKMAGFVPFGRSGSRLDFSAQKWSASVRWQEPNHCWIDARLIAGLGAAALAPIWPATGLAQGRPSLSLQAKAGSLALRAGPATPIWSLQGPELRFQRGDTVEVSFGNELPVPAVLDWRGIDGVPAAEPLTVRAPLATGGKQAFQLPLRHAGTFLCDLRLLGDAQAQPSQARALVVRESEAVAVDRDEVLLIEDWRIRADGTAIAPGAEPKDTAPVLYD